MKIFSFLIVIFFANTVHSENSMNQLEILKHYENCYDAIHPAAENSEEAFAWFSDIPHPLFNAVMHLSCTNVAPKMEALIEKTPLGNPISFWVHSANSADGLVEILKEKGFMSIITCPLMTWPVQSISHSEFDIRSADKTMEIFNQITSDVFHFDPVTKEKYADILKELNSENYLIFSEGTPVGTGILFANGKVGGIFNIAVLPDYQGKGLARAMMKFLMRRADELGLERLVLLSSPETEKLYRSLGFEKTLDIDIYTRSD